MNDEPKVELQASFHGIPIYTDESLPKGMVEFRDGKGRVIGTINDVEQLRVGAQPSVTRGS